MIQRIGSLEANGRLTTKQEENGEETVIENARSNLHSQVSGEQKEEFKLLESRN